MLFIQWFMSTISVPAVSPFVMSHHVIGAPVVVLPFSWFRQQAATDWPGADSQRILSLSDADRGLYH